MKFSVSLLCFFSFVFSQLPTLAQEKEKSVSWQGSLPNGFSVSLFISSTALSIADPLIIALDIGYPKNYQPELNTLRKTLLTHYELSEPPFALEKEIINTPQEMNGTLTQNIIFVLSPQLAGIHSLALREINFIPINGQNEQKKLLTPVFKIDVTTPEISFNPEKLIASLMPMAQNLPITLSTENKWEYSQNEELGDVASKRRVNLIKQKQFPWVFVLLFLVSSIVWLLIKYAPESLQTTPKKTIKPPLPADVAALKAIDALSDRKFKTPYFYELDRIIRKYIYERFQIDIFSLTTPEFVEKGKNLPKGLKEQLMVFFQRNDQRKFAKHRILKPEDYTEAEQEARTFIQNLR